MGCIDYNLTPEICGFSLIIIFEFPLRHAFRIKMFCGKTAKTVCCMHIITTVGIHFLKTPAEPFKISRGCINRVSAIVTVVPSNFRRELF